MDVKVLIIGSEPSDFFNPISLELVKNKISVDLHEFRKEPNFTDEGSYFKVYSDTSKLFNLHNYSLITFLKPLFSFYFWEKALQTFSIKEALRLSLIRLYYLPIFQKYDIINFHSIDERVLIICKFVPKKVKVVFSFWGSDLWVDDAKRRSMQRNVLSNASIITMQTPEMKEVFLNVFHSIPSSKISLQLFGISSNFFNTCNNKQFKVENRENLKFGFKIPLNKVVITISYCAGPVANQIKILERVNHLSSEIKSGLHLIIPLQYGSNEDYEFQINKLLIGQNYSTTIITKFLPICDLIGLKYCSDVYIHANKTDAFSKSMLENIYTENICLIANWLPYSLLKNKGLKLVWFDEFSELPILLTDIVKQLSNYKNGIENNARIIEQHFSAKTTIKKWVDLFKELK